VIAFFYALSHFNFMKTRTAGPSGLACVTGRKSKIFFHPIPLSRGDSPYLHNPYERPIRKRDPFRPFLFLFFVFLFVLLAPMRP
jgi:hypothetical protein